MIEIGRIGSRRCVTMNAAEFADTPKGQAGRPSKSLTLDQAAAMLRVSGGSRIGAYIALSPGTGIRAEEARAFQWEHLDFGDPHADPPRPASIAVWRSVRARGDTKTPRSRCTLGLPTFATEALADLQQHEGRTSSPVFATRDNGDLDADNVRREFRAAITAAGVAGAWSPRELRHTFVSLMSDSGKPVEESPPRRPHQLPHHRDRLAPPAPPRHGTRRPGHGQALRTHRLTRPAQRPLVHVSEFGRRMLVHGAEYPCSPKLRRLC